MINYSVPKEYYDEFSRYNEAIRIGDILVAPDDFCVINKKGQRKRRFTYPEIEAILRDSNIPGGWRLPTFEELKTMRNHPELKLKLGGFVRPEDVERYNQHPNVSKWCCLYRQNGFYWSSTPKEKWLFTLILGPTAQEYSDEEHCTYEQFALSVRLVRDFVPTMNLDDFTVPNLSEWEEQIIDMGGIPFAPQDFYVLDKQGNKKEYFTWYEALEIEEKILRPLGWRLPTVEESQHVINTYGYKRLLERLNLLLTGWIWYGDVAKYNHGDRNLPCGFGMYSHYWTRTPYEGQTAYCLGLHFSKWAFIREHEPNRTGNPIRLVRCNPQQS